MIIKVELNCVTKRLEVNDENISLRGMHKLICKLFEEYLRTVDRITYKDANKRTVAIKNDSDLSLALQEYGKNGDLKFEVEGYGD